MPATTLSPTSITVGNLTVSADADGIRISVHGAGSVLETALAPRDAVTLERFLAEQRNGDLRTGFRVPVHLLQRDVREAFAVSLVHQGRIYDALPVDLSLTGLLVRARDLDISARSDVTVRLLLDDYLAKLEAQVVRVDGDLVALYFVDAMRAGELDPPSQLGPIFLRLEQIYLRRRSEIF